MNLEIYLIALTQFIGIFGIVYIILKSIFGWIMRDIGGWK